MADEPDVTSAKRMKLKKLLKELEQYRGQHTELVTVYIPEGYDINKISNHLAQEQGTASNIKSSSTRKNVITALERMIQHLKLFKQTPPNGLALFSGNIADKPGDQDVRVWSIEPPIPLKVRIYRCDKEFVLEPLADMTESKNVFGLVVIDRRDATIGVLKGNAIIVLLHTHSEVPGKFRAGGQSAQRFSRQRALALKGHYKKIADYMKDQFLNMPNLQGIIIGGPSTTVVNFLNKEYITGDVEKKILGSFDLGYTGNYGLHELVDKAQDLLSKEGIMEQKKAMHDFLTILAKDPDKVAYGYEFVKDRLILGSVDVLLIYEDFGDDKIDELDELAAQSGSKLVMISKDTTEGKQLEALGGIAAILRY